VSDSNDIRSLFARYVRDEMTAEQLRDLETALRNDDNFRREFIEYMNIDSALGDMAALSQAEVAEIEQTSTARLGERRGVLFRFASYAGPIAAMLLVSAILWFATTGVDKGPVAELVVSVDAVLLADNQPWTRAKLLAGDYRLDQGLIHLRLDGGVKAFVEAPAHFAAVNGNRLLLRAGRISLSVPPDGIGFTVETPEAEIVDFGTEFSVDVASGASEVHVFEGFVRVQPRSGDTGKAAKSIDLRTAQAVKIEQVTEDPVEIELASDRFIRSFDEPQYSYPRLTKRLGAVATYRMPIRKKGLAADPPKYSGVLLTGEGGVRPPHASGVNNSGSLRVLANSTGRGGRIDTPPPLNTGRFTLAGFFYLEAPVPNGTIATNVLGDEGNFTISLNESGRLRAAIRDEDGQWQTATSRNVFPTRTWRHVLVTCDGERLRIFETGQLAASVPASPMTDSDTAPLWLGTDAEARALWNGRLDELAIFDRAVNEVELAEIHHAAIDEMAKAAD